MGHLEILVLGQSLLDGGRWEQVLEYLKQEPTIGENVYVFRSSNAAEAVGWAVPRKHPWENTFWDFWKITQTAAQARLSPCESFTTICTTAAPFPLNYKIW